MPFAVIHPSTLAVWGVGETREAAVADARAWSPDPVENLFVVPCTAAAAELVRRHGGEPGDPALEVTTDGVMLTGRLAVRHPFTGKGRPADDRAERFVWREGDVTFRRE